MRDGFGGGSFDHRRIWISPFGALTYDCAKSNQEKKVLRKEIRQCGDYPLKLDRNLCRCGRGTGGRGGGGVSEKNRLRNTLDPLLILLYDYEWSGIAITFVNRSKFYVA